MQVSNIDLSSIHNVIGSEFVMTLDVETTGTDPLRHSVISIGAVVLNTITGEEYEFYEECKPETLTPNYEHPSMKGFIVETWSLDAEKAHGFTFKEASGKQHPFDMAIKFVKFIEKFYKGSPIPFIYHANANFDWKFMKAWMYKLSDKLYFWFMKRFSYNKAYDTMRVARTYISSNKAQIKLIKDNESKLNKPRKTKPQKRFIDKWTEEIASANEQLKDKVIFEGYSLDKICRGLNVTLNHHNALSDSKALLPILSFFCGHTPELFTSQRELAYSN